MNSLDSRGFAERSPLQGLYPDAQLARLGETVIVSRYDARDESQALQRCGLVELTALPRFGVRGPQAAARLVELGFQIPERPNQSVEQVDGSRVLRLSQGEFMLLGSLRDGGERIRLLEQQWQEVAGCYPLPRQDSHAWLFLGGRDATATMAKVCGVDLGAHAFPANAVAQTSVARLNMVIASHRESGVEGFHLLLDRASLRYAWSALLDAMLEFDGQPVGLDALLDA